MHKVNKETLKEQHRRQQQGKAIGVDQMTKEKYGINLDENLDNLIKRMNHSHIGHNQLEEVIYQKLMEN